MQDGMLKTEDARRLQDSATLAASDQDRAKETPKESIYVSPKVREIDPAGVLYAVLN